jgi:hypothetical protein
METCRIYTEAKDRNGSPPPVQSVTDTPGLYPPYPTLISAKIIKAYLSAYAPPLPPFRPIPMKTIMLRGKHPVSHLETKDLRVPSSRLSPKMKH